MEGNYFFVERDIYICVCVWTEKRDVILKIT